jgi:cytochrome c553
MSANRKKSKVNKLLTSLAMAAALIVTGSLASPHAFAEQTETVPPQMSFLMFCAGCHGKTGGADGPTAASLSIKPRNFTDCAAMSKISDDTIFKVIKYGGASAGLSSEMPGWAAAMSDDEIKGLAKHVRSFCKK